MNTMNMDNGNIEYAFIYDTAILVLSVCLFWAQYNRIYENAMRANHPKKDSLD